MANFSEQYRKFIEGIFEEHSATILDRPIARNNVTGAILDPNFHRFTCNFAARLSRLNRIYHDHEDFNKIINLIRLIGSKKNWRGAYAELCAYDFLHSGFLNGESLLIKPIKLQVAAKPSEMFLNDNISQIEYNIDGFFEDLLVYFDVKCLKDNTKEIMDKVIHEVYERISGKRPHIVWESVSFIYYSQIEDSFRSLVEELYKALQNNSRPTYFKSNLITGLHYRFTWERGVQITFGHANEYEFAEKYHLQIFKYCNKFVVSRPFLIVFVVFPWAGQIISDFRNGSVGFYRSLSRRVFCQYRYSKKLLKDIKTKFKKGTSLWEATTMISGLLFLEDKCILSDKSENQNVDGFLYLNPNAAKRLDKTRFYDYMLNSLNLAIMMISGMIIIDI